MAPSILPTQRRTKQNKSAVVVATLLLILVFLTLLNFGCMGFIGSSDMDSGVSPPLMDRDSEQWIRRESLVPDLDGLQTRAMRQLMLDSCPHGLSTSLAMNFTTFLDYLMQGLEKVQTRQDPLDYVASQYSQLMSNRGALGMGFWAEFGVWHGTTLNQTFHLLQKTNFTGPVVGFDSFEGLPETWRGWFVKGRFATNYEKVRASMPEEIQLYKGWFQDTIGNFLADHPRVPASVVNHDGDLFLSTAITFAMLEERIVPGTILCFDELFGYPGFGGHEMLSLFTWMKQRQASLCPLTVMAPFNPVCGQLNLSSGCPQNKQGACFQVLDLTMSVKLDKVNRSV